MNACDQFLEIEGLRHVVVGSELQPGQLVLAIGARCQHDDGNPSALSPHSAEFEATLARQHKVEQDKIRPEGTRCLEGAVAIGDDLDLKPLEGEIVPEHTRKSGIVFNYQDSLRHGQLQSWAAR